MEGERNLVSIEIYYNYWSVLTELCSYSLPLRKAILTQNGIVSNLMGEFVEDN